MPAAAAAGAKAANTPAPIIEPSPMTTASVVPSRRASPGTDVWPGLLVSVTGALSMVMRWISWSSDPACTASVNVGGNQAWDQDRPALLRSSSVSLSEDSVDRSMSGLCKVVSGGRSCFVDCTPSMTGYSAVTSAK